MSSAVRSPRRSDVTPRTPLPLGWYVFFGIVEPVSVMAGCVYAIAFQENYYTELVPTGYLAKATSYASKADGGRSVASAWKVGTSAAAAGAAVTIPPLSSGAGAATRMALAQLGSCYFLIMLNSALMFYAIRRWFGQSPVAQERVLYFLFTVLGLADWTHILLTVYFLPSLVVATGKSTSTAMSNDVLVGLSDFLRKVYVLTTDFSVWNSLLFGNIVITFLLFCARAAWWIGLGRDRFFGGSVPDVPSAGLSSKKAS